MPPDYRGGLMFLAVCIFLVGVFTAIGKYEERTYYGNPGDYFFKIRQKSSWVPPTCKCKNCIHNGHREYWWEIQAWWTAGEGKHRKRRSAYLSGDRRYKTWKIAMMTAEDLTKNPRLPFWRGYN